MPKATVSVTTTFPYELKSVEGGNVVLRKMQYGQVLERLDMAGKMTFEKSKGDSATGEMQMMQQKVTCFEYACCVVDHNLEDEDERKLNFSQPSDIARLDPQVGAEISELISDLNAFDGVELKN